MKKETVNIIFSVIIFVYIVYMWVSIINVDKKIDKILKEIDQKRISEKEESE